MVILGNLELLEAALENQPALYKLVRTAVRGADRGAALVKSLLAFARKQPLEPVPVDLNKLLRETVEMLIRTLGENIEVEVLAKPGLWICEVDPGQLQSALLNLAINARDAMPTGGKLTIETDCAELDETSARQADVRSGQYVMLAVSDTGTGMTPDVLERVFDPFFTTKEPGKGSGLGLSMVYGVVKQSRGHVKITSEVGRGTTVRIYLPRIYDGPEPEPAPVSAIDQARGAESILVVEDDADVRTLTTTMLAGLGYRVLLAASAADARVLLAQQAPDLLLTDVILAGTANGRELADEALTLQPNLKVLFMSGYAENVALQQGRLGLNVQLLQKPFRIQDLAARVRAALDRTDAAKG
jgi:CheY-like chemotaxis protein